MTEFILRGHFGGTDINDEVMPIWRGIRNSMNALESSSYSNDIDKFQVAFGVSGNITKFKGGNGCANMRLMKKQRYITIDILMDKDIWNTKENKLIENFLKENMLKAFDLMIGKLVKAKLDIDAEKLKQDLIEALKLKRKTNSSFCE